jgi:hypothetical protein
MLTDSSAPVQVPSGLLPALELDGKLFTESATIAALLEEQFPENKPLLPPQGSPLRQKADILFRLERRLFGDWLGWLCQSWCDSPHSPTPSLRRSQSRDGGQVGPRAGPGGCETGGAINIEGGWARGEGEKGETGRGIERERERHGLGGQ